MFPRVVSRALLTLALAGTLAGAVGASARDDKCEERVRKAQRNLDDAVRKHGEHSRQAEQRRRQVEDARAHCGQHDRH